MKKFFTALTLKRFLQLQETNTLHCIIFRITYFFTLLKLTPNNNTQKIISFLQKTIIGAILAFIFWMPFFGFIAAEMLPPFYYNILSSILLILVFCLIGLLLRPDLIQTQISKKKSYFFTKLRSYIQKSPNNNIFLLYFWLFITISIVIYSIMHKNIYWITSYFYPISIALLLFTPRTYRFFLGFFIGIFGFYWMTLSFRFQDIGAFIPLAILGIGIIYGILFWFLFYFQNLFCRILAISLLFVIHPLDFNWLNVAYLSSYSIFKASFIGMLCICVALCIALLESKIRFLAPILFFFAFDNNLTIQTPKLQAKILQTMHAQDEKWSPDTKDSIIEENIKAIKDAIIQKYPIIILPETSFPFLLNKDPELYETLLAMSKEIIIFAGALRLQTHTDAKAMKHQALSTDSLAIQNHISLHALKQPDHIYNIPEQSYINPINTQEGYYNTTFIFANGHSIIADKTALVPFGETLPFNNLLSPIIENLSGEKFGFNQGIDIVTLDVDTIKIANANCYEGTTNLPYKTGAQYIIMSSNNAWFYPSTQSFMQQMLIKYYARNYNVFVYHSTNYTPKAIITPNNGKDNTHLP